MTKTIVLLFVSVIASLIGRSQYVEYADSLTAERFFEDSVGGTFMVEYRYEPTLIADAAASHSHYIANCSVIKYKGNRRQIIFANYKSIYSPTECSSDSRELWLKRLYQFLNKK